MPSKNPARRLEDVIEQAGYIAEYIAGMDEAALQRDRKTRDAVERCIERVIEATTKLDEDTRALLGDHPWKDLRGMGNWLRHGYDKVAPTLFGMSQATKCRGLGRLRKGAEGNPWGPRAGVTASPAEAGDLRVSPCDPIIAGDRC